MIERKTIKVEVRLSRLLNEPDQYHLVIEDRESGIQMLDVAMSGTDVAVSLTGASAECTAELGSLQLVGRKQVSVVAAVADVDAEPSSTLAQRRARRLADVAVTLERERPGYGWYARSGDLGNRHNAVARGSNVYEVVFFGHEPRKDET